MLRFCFGASGAGKSTGLYDEIIKKSMENGDQNFFIIVPDQFTMQTQTDVVKRHPNHAIMNIDVLSFGRLSHRIFEETGLGSFSVLDDVGKSLVLMKVAGTLGDRLPVIGKSMKRPGFVDEVKSTISEFMQYGITDEDLSVLEQKAAKKGALSAKIRDLRLLYREFLSYIEGSFITSEETLDILCSALEKSELIRDSVVLFDGFTGFTPIQYRVIKVLLSRCKQVIVSLTIDPADNPYASEIGEQELFSLSKKTVRDLEKLEYEVNLEKGGNLADFEAFRAARHASLAENTPDGDIFCRERPVKRLADNKALAFLEENLFRYKNSAYSGDNDSLFIYRAKDPASEIKSIMIKISDLVKSRGYAYRDIALVCGSLEDYGDIIARAASVYDIPVFIDKNTDVLLNPFIEYVTSALNIVISGYKYRDVFHYARSGMTDFALEDVDLLDDYVRALGISGKNGWEDRFVRRMPRKFKSFGRNKDEDNEKELMLLEKLNGMRAKMEEELAPLFKAEGTTARKIGDALLSVIENNRSEDKLAAFEAFFEEQKDLKKAGEYRQIYEKVTGLIRQISDLCGDDSMDIRQYSDILNTGFGDIKVGHIPQDVDRIIVGDIERTRLKEIRVLFFVGVNDTAIPKGTAGGGLLSDIDRQFLLELNTGVELAPTPRQQIYIQRLYLYMNLTKPTDRLYLSFSQLTQDGKSQRPAYLIPKICEMYKDIQIQNAEDAGFEDMIVGPADSVEMVSSMMREYASGRATDEEKTRLMTLISALKGSDEDIIDRIAGEAFKHYESKPLSRAIALALYGARLDNSVSRLEKFAGCCYAHFIDYGLRLEERKEYAFNPVDLGSVYHEVLQGYTDYLIANDIDWATFPKEESDKILNDVLTSCIDRYGDSILRSSKRNSYMAERIHRILSRTVETLKYQISKGRFKPAFVEMAFSSAEGIDQIDLALSEDEKDKISARMRLKGKIDRVDLYEDDENIYVKVIDYKSGNKSFSLASLYYGLSLQLVMYMDVALKLQKKKAGNKNVLPAAILYYHVNDPIIEASEDLQPDVINQKVIKELKMTGLVSDDENILQLIDRDVNPKSDVIPVEFNKNGGFSAASKVASKKEYDAITKFATGKLREFGNRILNGDISINPYEMKQSGSCTYCRFRSICGFDAKVPGYEKRQLQLNDKDALEHILNET